MTEFNDKVAVVPGSGMGTATARRLAADGATVAPAGPRRPDTKGEH